MARKKKRPGQYGPELEPYQIILRPLVTEKGTHLATRFERRREHAATKTKRGLAEAEPKYAANAYQFQVNPYATKEQIRQAVEALFGVTVAKVRTQNRLGKTRRFRNRIGRLPNWKKAIVTLKGEDRLEFF